MLTNRNQRYRYRYTIWGMLAIAYYLALGLMLVMGAVFVVVDLVMGIPIWSQWLLAIAVVSLVAVIPIFRLGYIRKLALEQRQDTLHTLGTKSRDSRPIQSPTFRTDGEIVSEVGGKGWRLADYKFNVDYPIGRGATVVGEHRYISVLELDLPRQLPAMVFDSRKGVHALGRGLDRSQATTLGGRFDDIFTTYFPLHYHIDTRSIISTPTMQAMLKLDDCDFEIFDDKLHIYHAMVDDDKLSEFIDRGKAVKRTLERPLKNYRDHLVGDATNRQSVSVVGARLRESVWTEIACMAGGMVVLATLIYVAITTSEYSIFWLVLSIMFSLLFVVGGWYGYHTKTQHNRSLDREYKQRSLGRTSTKEADSSGVKPKK